MCPKDTALTARGSEEAQQAREHQQKALLLQHQGWQDEILISNITPHKLLQPVMSESQHCNLQNQSTEHPTDDRIALFV